MGFSLPPRSLAKRWALTPPFHPCRRHTASSGGMFSVALSVEKPFDFPPASISIGTDLSYAASRPAEFGLSSPGLRPERFSALPESLTAYPNGGRLQGGPGFQKHRWQGGFKGRCERRSRRGDEAE